MAKLPEYERVVVESRAALRSWLSAHHAQRESIWLVTYKKGKGPYVSYDDIVEEVICFGWIDSRPAKLDDDRSMLLLSPRKPKSNWSQVNKDRVAKVEAMGLIAPAGQAMIDLAKKTGTWDALRGVDLLQEPEDLVAALASVSGARLWWDQFPPSSRRGILEWINAARKAETRVERIARTASLASQGIKANFPEGRNRASPKKSDAKSSDPNL